MIGQRIVERLKGTDIDWGLTESNGYSYIQIENKTFKCDRVDRNEVRKMTRRVNKFIDEILNKRSNKMFNLPFTEREIELLLIGIGAGTYTADYREDEYEDEVKPLKTKLEKAIHKTSKDIFDERYGRI